VHDSAKTRSLSGYLGECMVKFYHWNHLPSSCVQSVDDTAVIVI
jgi:hypothetical protein